MTGLVNTMINMLS